MSGLENRSPQTSNVVRQPEVSWNSVAVTHSPTFAMPRIRQCVQCPKCLLRYVVSASPYCNGSYLVRLVDRSEDEYRLYCSCAKPPFCSRWRSASIPRASASQAAYLRGYGTSEEIALMEIPSREATSCNSG